MTAKLCGRGGVRALVRHKYRRLLPFTVSLTARGIPTGDQIRNLGLDPDDLKAARAADVPFLVH